MLSFGLFPWIHHADATGLEVGGVAGGKGETVNLGGGGDEGVLNGSVVCSAKIGGQFGDRAIHVQDVELIPKRDDIIVPRGEVACEYRVTKLDLL